MNVFLDTNVWISALSTQGTCFQLLEHLEVAHTLTTTPAVLAELERILPRKVRFTHGQTQEALRIVLLLSALADPVPLPVGACRDKGDLPILGAAVAAKCDCLITGDKDLLVLRRIRGVAILPPSGFWRFEAGHRR